MCGRAAFMFGVFQAISRLERALLTSRTSPVLGCDRVAELAGFIAGTGRVILEPELDVRLSGVSIVASIPVWNHQDRIAMCHPWLSSSNLQ